MVLKYFKNKGEVLFSITIFLYFFIYLINQDYAKKSFIETASMFTKIVPILIIVFIFSLLVDKYLDKEKAEKYMGENSSKKAWFYAIISSIIIAGPPYILFPLLGDLKNKGVKNSYLAIFLYNRNVKIPFIPVMIYYFGLLYTVVISILMIIFSIISGLIFETKYLKKI